jgi:hypothetical protein
MSFSEWLKESFLKQRDWTIAALDFSRKELDKLMFKKSAEPNVMNHAFIAACYAGRDHYRSMQDGHPLETDEIKEAALKYGFVIVRDDASADTADVATMHYLCGTGVRGALKGTVKESGTASYIWDADGVNGYNAVASNQVPDNKVLFGNFRDCVFARWEGIDIVVDEYSLKKSGKVEIYISQMIDFAVRHPESFCISTDAGNQ